MRAHAASKRSDKGFTLIEVIVTILVTAVLASIFFTFLSAAVTRSADPIWQAQDLAAAEASMERITAAYGSYLTTGNPAWTTFKSPPTPYPNATLVPCNIPSASTFDKIQATVTVGNHTLISYFMQ